MTRSTFACTLCLLAISCSIVPEGTLDYFPAGGRPKTISVNAGVSVLKGAVSYEGPFTSPTKIQIAWTGTKSLNRVPIADVSNSIVTTSYELNGGRVVRITNINTGGKAQRVEDITYTQNRISKVVQTNNVTNGSLFYQLTNDFYYKSNNLDSIAQRVCWYDGVCWNGFIVSMLDREYGNVSVYDGCNGGTSLESANFTGIMPYTAGKPYTLSSIGQYYNATTNQYELSPNDFQKTFYKVLVGDEGYNTTRSFAQVLLYGETVDQCIPYNFGTTWEFGNADPAHFNHYADVSFVFEGANSQLIYPVYYYALINASSEGFSAENTFLVPQADLLQMLNKKIECLYLDDQLNGKPVPSKAEIIGKHVIEDFDFQR